MNKIKVDKVNTNWVKKERQEITCEVWLNNGQIMLKQEREREMKSGTVEGEECKIILELERTSYCYGTECEKGVKKVKINKGIKENYHTNQRIYSITV